MYTWYICLLACRDNYVRCICKQCPAIVCAALHTSSTWKVTRHVNGAGAPCKLSVTQSVSSVSVKAEVPSPSPDHPVIIAPPPVLKKCCICDDELQQDQLIQCPNPGAHLMCLQCFELNVSSQFGEDLPAFLNRNCTIVCNCCSGQAEPFNMQALMPR